MKIIKLTMLDFNHSIGFKNVKSSKQNISVGINKTPRNSFKDENTQNILLVGVGIIVFLVGFTLFYEVISDKYKEKDLELKTKKM
jgi:hypothetical protein